MSDFISMSSQRARLPSIFLTNLRSINNKFDDLRCQISASNPDVIICTETWLNSSVPNQALNFSGYDIFRTDRLNDSPGGGVAIWSKSFLHAEKLSFPLFENIELCCITLPKCKLLILGIYIPPGLPHRIFQEFCNSFTNCLDNVLLNLCNYFPIIAGDFNRYNCDFLINDFSMSNIVSEPTRCNAVLDLIFIDSFLNMKYTSQNVEIGPPIGSSDHNSIFVIPSDTKFSRASRKHTFYDLRLSHVLAFENEFIHHSQLSSFFAENDVNVKCYLFNKIMHDSMYVIPKHVVYLSDSDAPWFTPFLKFLVNKRWEAFRSHNWEMYNFLKVKVKTEIFKAKTNFFRNKARSVKGMWSYVRMERGANANAYYDRIINDSSIPTKDVLNHLNNQFCSVMTPKTTTTDLFDVQDDGWLPSFSVVDVWLALSRLSTMATGSDDIPTQLYKKSAVILAEPMFHLIMTCIQKRTFPDAWKIADVIPVPKSSQGLTREFRPISLLPIPSKIAENFILRDMSSQLSSCFGWNQFGIRKASSTAHAIITAHDLLTSLFDDSNIGASVLISFDFSKAFDKINHEHLLMRAMDLKLPTGFILFLKSYLHDRRQRVRVFNMRSELNVTSSGVPQGSLLGPYLFGMYISTLRPHFSSTCMIKYVDDICIIAGIQKSESALDVEKVIREISNMKEWSNSNYMTLNSSKTCGIVNYRGSFKDTCNIENIIDSVTFSSRIKLLGVILAQDLSWSSHIDCIIKKCVQRMYILRRIKNFTSISEFTTIYIGLIRSLMEYASPAFVGLSSGDAHRLQMIQNRCARIKEGVVLPNLTDRRKSLASKCFKKVLSSDTLIRSLAPRFLPSGRLDVPYCRTSLRRDAFFPYMCILSSQTFLD